MNVSIYIRKYEDTKVRKYINIFLFPFIIYSYIHMLLLACPFRADGQYAVLRLHSRLRHRTMRYKRVIAARRLVHASFTAIENPCWWL